MMKLYSESLEVRSCNCDMFSFWAPAATLTAMQETAGAHVALLGLDRTVMADMNLGWVVSRLKVEFTRLPRVGETLTIETWPTPNRHLFFPRSHAFRDATGAQIGCANSLWLTLDLTDRRAEKNDFVISRIPDNRDLPSAAGMPATVRPLNSAPVVGSILPGFSDLDSNGHVNNTRYMEWCMNALGLDVLRDRCLTAFDVNFDSEILPGCEIHTELTMDGDRFAFIGFDETGHRHFGIGGTLSNRNGVE